MLCVLSSPKYTHFCSLSLTHSSHSPLHLHPNTILERLSRDPGQRQLPTAQSDSQGASPMTNEMDDNRSDETEVERLPSSSPALDETIERNDDVDPRSSPAGRERKDHRKKHKHRRRERKHRHSDEEREQKRRRRKGRHRSSTSNSDHGSESFDSEDGGTDVSSDSETSRRKKRSKRMKKKSKSRKKEPESIFPQDAEAEGGGDAFIPAVNSKGSTGAATNPKDGNHQSHGVGSGQGTAPVSRRMMPMSREEYEAEQSQIREVYDPESGRTRLVRGRGEIIERIVSRETHQTINQQATRGDGASFSRTIYRAASSRQT